MLSALSSDFTEGIEAWTPVHTHTTAGPNLAPKQMRRHCSEFKRRNGNDEGRRKHRVTELNEK